MTSLRKRLTEYVETHEAMIEQIDMISTVMGLDPEKSQEAAELAVALTTVEKVCGDLRKILNNEDLVVTVGVVEVPK